MSAAASVPLRSGHRPGEPPKALVELVERFDGEVFDARQRVTRVRLEVVDLGAWDVVVRDGVASLGTPAGVPDTELSATEVSWRRIARDLRLAMDTYQAGRLRVRRNVHAGVGFLAATSNDSEPGRLRFASVATRGPRLSLVEAGTGPTVLALHGLGATKSSFLTTIAALADDFRVIAVDLPGFGDSDKPIGAAYDAAFFADAVIGLLDALELDRVHLLGNSLGGRISLEVGLRDPDRVSRIGLLAPSLAWRRGRPWQPLLRLVRPELGLLQLAPRPVVERFVRWLIPDASDGWAAAGVDEFLRAYLTRSGRAAFYAAARHIYLDEPHGERGFWTRLATLEPPALFIWGRHDRLVPLAFARHVVQTLPRASHLELDCGHVPQIELPGPTHSALGDFFAARRASGVRARIAG
jgi:pimeloyl-ACP methyl ester carboxylesterase